MVSVKCIFTLDKSGPVDACRNVRIFMQENQISLQVSEPADFISKDNIMIPVQASYKATV